MFSRKAAVYISINQESVLFNTVARNRQQFTNPTPAAKELSKRLDHPSPRSLIDMINNGSLVNCSVTAKDVARAYHIFGPDLESLRTENRKHLENLSSIFSDRCQYKCISNLIIFCVSRINLVPHKTG